MATKSGVALERPTRTQHVTMQIAAVIGLVLATVKQVLAAALGLEAVRLYAVAKTRTAAQVGGELTCLLAAHWTPSALRAPRGRPPAA